MKKQIHRDIKRAAYFVREHEVALTEPSSSRIDSEHITNEPLDVATRRLRYKIDRGEYDYFNVVYARKVWDHLIAAKKCVPVEIVERWYTDVLSNFLEKTQEQFVEKFHVESLIQELSGEDRISYIKELYDYLCRDVRKRAASEPLLELPKFVLDEIEDTELVWNTNAT